MYTPDKVFFSLILIFIQCRRTFVNAGESNSTVLNELFGEKIITIDKKVNSSVLEDLSRNNFTTGENKWKSDILAERFRKKYTGKGYTKWQELHEARPRNLTEVCYEDALTTFGNANLTMRLTTEASASFRDRYSVIGFNEIEVDTLTCVVKFVDAEGKARARLAYNFCEGDEPGSAFRFTLAQKSFILTNRIHNIWSNPIRKDKSRPAFVNATRV